MIDSSITALATTVTIGACSPRLRLLRIHSGSVSSPALEVNVVTTISSKLSPKASSPPASSAVRISGNVTWR